MIGGGFNKQESLHMKLVLGNYKLSRCLHPPTRILRVYIEVLMGCSHVYSPDGLNHRWLFQAAVLKGLFCRTVSRAPNSRMGRW